MRSFPPPQIIVFDNDGTLVPSHEVANPAIQEGFAAFCKMRGIDVAVPSDARIRELTGQPGSVFYRSLLPERWAGLAEKLRTFCLDREVEGMLARARFYPGIEEMLGLLKRRGIGLVVASHGGERYIEAVAKRLAYRERFDRVFYHGLDGLVTKGEMARRALAELGGGDGLFVGDRRADAEAAVEAGIPFVGCLYGYGGIEEMDGADLLVETPSELAALLLRVTRG